MESTVTSQPDGSLLEEYVRTQNPVAFDQLARRYRGMVFSVARRVTQSHHDAEDVAQSCFLELARKAASIRISIPAFLHATATRRSIDILRDQSRRRKHEKKAASDRGEPIAQDYPLERSWDEISPEVDEAIENLPSELKSLVILYFLRGLSVADIAVETGINRRTIERRLQVGIRRLRAELAKGNRIVATAVLTVGFKSSISEAVPASLTASTGRMALAAGLNPFGSELFPATVGSFKWILPASVLALAAVLSVAFAWKSDFASRRPASAPYDEMNRLYAGYLPVSDTSGFFLHAAQMRTDSSAFWRGSQPLFFQWCKANCQDWFSRNDSYVLCQASPNLEDAERLASSVNTDDSARLPIQIEMLQGMIIARLATDRSLDGESGRIVDDLARTICESYAAALKGEAGDIPVQSGQDGNIDSSGYLDGNGNFRTLILSRQNKLLEFLRPSPYSNQQLESMIAEAIAHGSALGEFCKSGHPQVLSARACVRHGSVVAQGQLLLLVQLKGVRQLLQIKQQIPASAELADAVVRDSRSAGQRAAEDATRLSSLSNLPIGWCYSREMSFTAAPLDSQPQVYELRKDRWLNPVDAGRIWARCTANTHRNDPDRSALAALITPQLQLELVARSDACLKVMQNQLKRFLIDPRVAKDRSNEDALTARWLEQTDLEISKARLQ